VFAITQVTELMSSDLTWRGLGRGFFARKGRREVRPALSRLVPSTIVGPSLVLLAGFG
jgi:hypothetical protein